jgi:histidyl-tRNA synthetase
LADKPKFQAIKGVRDILPPDSALWNRVEQAAREVFGTFGFAEIRLPILEQTELFARSVGADTDIVNKEMYVFDLQGSEVLELWRDIVLGKYLPTPDDAGPTPLEADRQFAEFNRQIDLAIANDRLPKTKENSEAGEKLRMLGGQFHDTYERRQALPQHDPYEWTEEQLQLSETIRGFASEMVFGSYVALRPEATASVVRAYIEHGMQVLPGPLKFYYMGPMFRRERPQKGRYRQFYQIGAEVLGKGVSVATDAEVIAMLMNFFEWVGLSNHTLFINSIGCRAENCRPAYLALLRVELLKIKDKLEPDSRRRIETNPLRVLDSKIESEQAHIEALPHITNHLCASCKQEYESLKSILLSRGVKFQENWRLVRGLDYYTETTFEVTVPGAGAQNAICGGGRYDGLVELLGGPKFSGISGVGFAIGEDRLIEAVRESGRLEAILPLEIYVAWMGKTAERAQELAKILRENGFGVEVPAGEQRLGKSINMASRKGARFVVIVGENEVLSGRYIVKRLANSDQDELSEQEMIKLFEKEIKR